MKSFWKRPKTILWSLVILLILVFIFQNVQPVQVKLYFWSLPEMPLLLLIMLFMLLGAILALLISWEIRSNRNKKSAGKYDAHNNYY